MAKSMRTNSIITFKGSFWALYDGHIQPYYRNTNGTDGQITPRVWHGPSMMEKGVKCAARRNSGQLQCGQAPHHSII